MSGSRLSLQSSAFCGDWGCRRSYSLSSGSCVSWPLSDLYSVVLGGVAIPAGFIGLNRLSNDGDNTQAFVVLGVAVVLFVLFAAPNT